MIQNAIDKKQTFNELISEANAMVTSVLNDSQKRSLNVLPSLINFGTIRANEISEMSLTIKNEDMQSSRVHIKGTKDPRIKIQQEVGGAIAPGITRKVFI